MTQALKQYFQLIEVFTFREIKTRYRGSILGPLWLILNPIVTTIILNTVFGNFIKINTGNIPYFIFLLSGLIYWKFFQEGLTLAQNSFLWSRDLVTKTVFAKDTIPISFIFSKIPDYATYTFLLLLFYIANGFEIKVSVILLIVPIFPLLMFSVGIALFVSVANAIFRDFGKVLDLFLMILFYVTPIIYPDNLVPKSLVFINTINPLALIIIFVRGVIFLNIFRWDILINSIILSLITFICGFIFFKKIEKKMVDLI